MYKIIGFNEDTGTLSILIHDNIIHNIQIPLDDFGLYYEGGNLNQYINGFIPQVNVNRQNTLNNGIGNISVLKKLIKPLQLINPNEKLKQYLLNCLKISDWTQLTDAQLLTSQKLSWNAYRKLIRELLNQNLNISNVTIPIKPSIDTRINNSEKLEIMRLVQNIDNYIEIGVYQGTGMQIVGESFPNIKKIIGIDSYQSYVDDYSNYKHFDSNLPDEISAKYFVYPEQVECNKELALEKIKKDSRMSLIIQASKDAAKNLNIDFDFVYLDAHYRKDLILNDILTWYPKVKIGGIISGYEWSSNPTLSVLPYIKNALNTLEVSANIEILGDHWFIRKN